MPSGEPITYEQSSNREDLDIDTGWISAGELPPITFSAVPLGRGTKVIARPHLWKKKREEPWSGLSPRHDLYLFLAHHHASALGISKLPRYVVEHPVLSSAELGRILSEVNDLAFEIEEDEHGLVRPSYHAQKHCLKLLLSLARIDELVRPNSIGTDANGAIRISWSSGDREAELVCPSEEEEQPYVYYSASDEYGTDDEVSSGELAARIHWAVSGR